MPVAFEADKIVSKQLTLDKTDPRLVSWEIVVPGFTAGEIHGDTWTTWGLGLGRIWGQQVPGAVPHFWAKEYSPNFRFHGYVYAENGPEKYIFGLTPGEADEILAWFESDGLHCKVISPKTAKNQTVSVYMGKGPQVMSDYSKYLAYQRECVGVKPITDRVGWFTWPSKGQEVSSEWIVSQLDSLKEAGVEMVIIDDGWQRHYGLWESRVEFGNMQKVIEEIKTRRMKPGIWAALLAVSPGTETYNQFSEKGWILKHGNDDVDLSGMVAFPMSAVDIALPAVREYVLSQVDHLIEMGFEVLKLDYWNWAHAGDYTLQEKTYTQLLEMLMVDIRGRIDKINTDQGKTVELMACGPMLTLSKWTQYQRACDDPEPIPVETSFKKLMYLTQLRNSQAEFVFRALGLWPGFEKRLMSRYGYDINSAIEMVKEYFGGDIYQFFIRKYALNLAQASRSVYSNGTIAEVRYPGDASPGLSGKEIQKINDGILSLVAQGLLGSIWFGHDFSHDSDHNAIRWHADYVRQYKAIQQSL